MSWCQMLDSYHPKGHFESVLSMSEAGLSSEEQLILVMIC